MKEVSMTANFAKSPRNAREFPKSYIDGVSRLPAQRARIPKLTHRRPIGGSPFGQRLRAVHTHLQPSCVLYIVHPTSYIGKRIFNAFALGPCRESLTRLRYVVD